MKIPDYMADPTYGYDTYGVKLAIRALEIEASLTREKYPEGARIILGVVKKMKRTLKGQPWIEAMEWPNEI